VEGDGGGIGSLFNDQWVIENKRGEIKKFLEFNENESTIY
jgi:hypothetical protein